MRRLPPRSQRRKRTEKTVSYWENLRETGNGVSLSKHEKIKFQDRLKLPRSPRTRGMLGSIYRIWSVTFFPSKTFLSISPSPPSIAPSPIFPFQCRPPLPISISPSKYTTRRPAPSSLNSPIQYQKAKKRARVCWGGLATHSTFVQHDSGMCDVAVGNITQKCWSHGKSGRKISGNFFTFPPSSPISYSKPKRADSARWDLYELILMLCAEKACLIFTVALRSHIFAAGTLAS